MLKYIYVFNYYNYKFRSVYKLIHIIIFYILYFRHESLPKKKPKKDECIFPFVHKYKIYNDCVLDDDGNRRWCYTKGGKFETWHYCD